jgi:hypothetical protein
MNTESLQRPWHIAGQRHRPGNGRQNARNMTGQRMKRIARLLGIAPVVATVLLLAQRADCAGTDSAAPVADRTTKTAGKESARRVGLGLDNDGNVMLRFRRTSLTLIYGPEGTGQEIKTRLGLAPPLKESVGMGEMSFKVSFVF